MVRQRLSRLKTWRGRINYALANKLTKEEHYSLQLQAGEWGCCAVGANRVALEKAGVTFFFDGPNEYAGGNSAKAYHLGVKFADAVFLKRYRAAAKILTEIEKLK